MELCLTCKRNAKNSCATFHKAPAIPEEDAGLNGDEATMLDTSPDTLSETEKSASEDVRSEAAGTEPC